jgi:hypothetical protein
MNMYNNGMVQPKPKPNQLSNPFFPKPTSIKKA